MIKIGNLDIKNIKLGQADISAAYLGEQEIYSAGPEFTEVDYVYVYVDDTWYNSHRGLGYGWLPIKSFTIDIDTIKFENEFLVAKEGANYTRSTTGFCLCENNDQTGLTVQQHNATTNTVLYMQSIRIYNSDSSNSTYRIDSRGDISKENIYPLTSQIVFSSDKPQYSGTPGITQDYGWATGSSSQTWNSARARVDGMTVNYLRFAVDSTESSTYSSKIHKFSVINNDVKVLDLIPVLLTDTNKYALYDKISKNYIDRIVTDDNYTIYFQGE